MNGPLIVKDNPRFTPGRVLVDRESQVVAHVFHPGAAQEIADLEQARRDPDFSFEIERLITCFSSQLNRSQQFYDLGVDYDISPYQDGLNRIDRAIGLLKKFRQETQQMAQHEHAWNESGYCSICGADGNA